MFPKSIQWKRGREVALSYFGILSMVNHPNRSRKKAADDESASPSPEAIKQARLEAGLSQSAAAALIYSPLITWQKWEQGQESGGNRMHPAFFKLFKLKVARSWRPLGELPEPTPEAILAKRNGLELTRKAAAALLMVTESGWQRWEAEGTAGRPMHAAFWELFHVLTKNEGEE